MVSPEPGTKGKEVATVGAVMIASSIILAGIGVDAGTLLAVLQLGGALVGVVGIILWRVKKI